MVGKERITQVLQLLNGDEMFNNSNSKSVALLKQQLSHALQSQSLLDENKALLDGNEIRYWSLIISVVFLLLGIINSKILTPLNKIWFKIGILLGNIISPIIMSIIFFLVVTPTAFIMKILRKDLLNLKKNTKNSYWIEKKNQNSRMKNQF